MERENTTTKTLGVKLKEARKAAGFTQEQLAVKLMVSRQAITKWETDKGMPDIENLKLLSQLLGVSIDYLLDNGARLDLSVIRESINLDDYPSGEDLRGRLNRKLGRKDMVVRNRYPNAEIHSLVGRQLETKAEKVVDNVLGFVFDAPFGVPEVIHSLKNADKEFYLVDDAGRQYLVTVFDEFMESRQLSEKLTASKFEIGSFSFVRGVLIQEAPHSN